MDAQESQIFKALIIAIAVVASVIAYFIYSVIKQQKRVLLLQEQNAKAEITALEKDRERIAADIHDDLAPMLVAIKMKISSFELTDGEDEAQLESTFETIDDMAKRMRAISFDLMPATLKAKGLEVAVKEFVSQLGRESPLKIKLQLPEAPLLLDEQKTIHCYRILQEIIHNTLKHAKASELLVVMKKEAGHLQILTRDNGRGFNYRERLKEEEGLGLRSLLNRVNLMGGELHVESSEGNGTAYQISIPTNND